MNKQRGFSLIEVFVALAIGLFLVLGVTTIFSSMKVTAEQTSRYGQLKENGQLAMNFLTNDLMRQSFWGDMVGPLTFSALSNVPAQLANDCVGNGLNNSTFPLNVSANFRTLWGETSTTVNALNCINNTKVGSDIIHFKRVISSVPVLPSQVNVDKFYLMANSSSGTIFDGSAGVPANVNGNIWEYQHHIYHIRENVINGQTIPVLVQGRLDSNNNPFTFTPLVDGIELLHFTYGVDTDGDGVVNTFLAANNMIDAYWDGDNDNQILAITVYLLVRDILPDRQYENRNTYNLGNRAVNFMNNGTGDNFHRLLLTSTISLYNAGIDLWQ